MTIKEALKQRVPRIRKPVWISPECYLRLPLLADGSHGPWAELYDEATQRIVLEIRPGSQQLLVTALDDDDFEPYIGKVSEWEHDQQNFAHGYAEQ